MGKYFTCVKYVTYVYVCTFTHFPQQEMQTNRFEPGLQRMLPDPPGPISEVGRGAYCQVPPHRGTRNGGRVREGLHRGTAPSRAGEPGCPGAGGTRASSPTVAHGLQGVQQVRTFTL